jgi:hypothetical protein
MAQRGPLRLRFSSQESLPVLRVVKGNPETWTGASGHLRTHPGTSMTRRHRSAPPDHGRHRALRTAWKNTVLHNKAAAPQYARSRIRYPIGSRARRRSFDFLSSGGSGIPRHKKLHAGAQVRYPVNELADRSGGSATTHTPAQWHSSPGNKNQRIRINSKPTIT